MQPIISPMFFYWANITDSVKTLATVILIIGIPTMLVVTIARLSDILEWGPKEIKTFYRRIIIIIVIATAAIIFVPSKETLYQMLAAQWITPNNIQNTTDALLQFSTELMKVFGS